MGGRYGVGILDEEALPLSPPRRRRFRFWSDFRLPAAAAAAAAAVVVVVVVKKQARSRA